MTHVAAAIFGLLLGAAWAFRTIEAAIGIRTIPDISEAEWDAAPETGPEVTIVVPAKNEEECIEKCLRSLLALEYQYVQVIAVDDRSSDSTGKIMDALAQEQPQRLSVIHVTELPERWLGKTHAMWTAAQRTSSEWVLFTDGDVIFRKDSVRRAIAYAQHSKADHLVLYPAVIMKGLGERMMIGFLQIAFLLGNRAWKVADPKARDHIGVGAFNLISRNAYQAIGTYEALRLEVIDDLKLGRAVKQAGFAQRNVFGDDLIKLRWAKGALGIANNLGKNFFAFMGYRWYLALGAAIGALLFNLGPFVGAAIAHGSARAGYVLALCSIAMMYAGMSSKAKISPLFFLLHPVGAVLTVYAMLRSMYLTLMRGGVSWRGTTYPLDELRNTQR